METLEKTTEKTRFGFGENDGAFFVGNKPWYALGTQVSEAPSVEEAIKLAKLDWNVELQDIQTKSGVDLEQKAVIRTDINKPLGVTSKKYTVLQNTEAFSFFESFLENNLATLDTAGSLFNGRKVFILAKINREDMIIDENHDDRVEKYILLSNSHDGSSAVRIGYTPIRISCSNTLTAAHTSDKSQLIRVYHKGNIVKVLHSIQETMNLIDQTFIATEEKYKELTKKSVKKEDLQKYVKQVFSKKSLEELLNNKTALPDHEVKATRKKLMEHVEEVFDMEYAQNAWTAYNAVNHWLNHGRGRTVETSYNNLWFANAKKLDQKALELALHL